MSVALLAAKLALGPVLLPQARWLKRTALRLPEPAGPRQGQVGARWTHQILQWQGTQ